MKKIIALMLCAACCISFAGCRLHLPIPSNEAKEEFFAMDTYMTLTAYGENSGKAVRAAKNEILELEQLVSATVDTSEIYELNQNGTAVVSEETAHLIEISKEYWERTVGYYDITVYPLVEEWGFVSKDFHVPSKERIDELLPLVGSEKIEVEDLKDGTYRVTFATEGMKVDLGTIAKGYASQKAAETFKKYGVDGIINLGGNVQVVGTKEDGSPWRVAIQKPDKDAEDTEYIGTVDVEDCAVTTAGGYERYFEEGGVEYRHIFDPQKGAPTKSTLKSVSVIAKNGETADGFDTPLFCMDKDLAIEYWQMHADEFDVIIVGEDDTIYVSEGIADKFTPQDENAKVEVLIF